MEVSGEKYGVPSAQMVAKSEPQMPLRLGRTRTHFDVGKLGSGKSRADTIPKSPVYCPGKRRPTARSARYRGMLLRN